MTGFQVLGVALNRRLKSSLEEMEAKKDIEGLRNALKDEDAYVRCGAEEAL